MFEGIRIGDKVQVTSGPDRGWVGVVEQVRSSSEPLCVEVGFGRGRQDRWFASFEPHQLKVVEYAP